MHACNYLSTRDKTFTTTMDNYIIMQPMPNLRYGHLFYFFKNTISNQMILFCVLLCNHIWVWCPRILKMHFRLVHTHL